MGRTSQEVCQCSGHCKYFWRGWRPFFNSVIFRAGVNSPVWIKKPGFVQKSGFLAHRPVEHRLALDRRSRGSIGGAGVVFVEEDDGARGAVLGAILDAAVAAFVAQRANIKRVAALAGGEEAIGVGLAGVGGLTAKGVVGTGAGSPAVLAV